MFRNLSTIDFEPRISSAVKFLIVVLGFNINSDEIQADPNMILVVYSITSNLLILLLLFEVAQMHVMPH